MVAKRRIGAALADVGLNDPLLRCVPHEVGFNVRISATWQTPPAATSGHQVEVCDDVERADRLGALVHFYDFLYRGTAAKRFVRCCELALIIIGLMLVAFLAFKAAMGQS